jgi:hypothetical protein
MPGILDLMNSITEAGDRGRVLGQQSRLGQLYSGAMQAPEDQRNGYLAEMAKISPSSANTAQTNFSNNDENSKKSLVQSLGMASAAWKAGNKDMAQGFYSQALPHLSSMAGGKPPPAQMDDAAVPVFDSIVQSVSGKSALPNSVQEYQYAQGHPGYQQFLDGRAPATPFSMPVPGGTQTVLYNSRTKQFTGLDGSPMNANGGATQGAQQQGQPGPTFGTVGGGNVQTTRFAGTDGKPVNISNELPPEVRQSILANTAGYSATPDGGSVAIAQQPPAAMPPRIGFKPDKAEESFSQLTPQELSAAGLPPGTFAQRSKTGKIDVSAAGDRGSTGTEGLSGAGKNLIAAATAVGYNMPMPSMGFGKAGAANKVASINQLAAQYAAAGLTPEQGIERMIQGKTATQGLVGIQKTYVNVRGWEASANAQADIALEMSGKASRTGLPVFNAWLLAGRQATGDVDVSNFIQANNALAEEYAKVMSGNSGGGASTDSARAQAHSQINSAQTPEQYTAKVALLRREMAARMGSLQSTIASQRGDIMGRTENGPAANAGPEPGAMSQVQAMQHLQDAREAIKNGADKEAVRQRLIQMGLKNTAGRL